MRRRRLLGWSAVTLLALAGLAWVWVAIRRTKQSEDLDALVARHEREGRGTTLADFLDREPELDPDLQQRFRTWHEASQRASYDYAPEDPCLAFLAGAKAPPPDGLWAQHEKLRPHMTELARMLATGRLRVSSLAWARAEFGEKKLTWHAVANASLPGAWSLNQADLWFQVEALFGDRGAGLAALDRIPAALAPAGVLLDAWFRVAMRGLRDRTYLALAMRGMLPTERRDAWLAEKPLDPAVFAESYRGQRILYALPFARAVTGGDLDAVRAAVWHRAEGLWDHIDFEIYLRSNAGRDAAYIVDLMARTADVLRDPTSPALRETHAWRSGAGFLLGPELDMRTQSLRSLVEHHTMHRAVRLAVRALGVHTDGGLPRSHADFRTRLGPAATLLDAAPWSLALRYERLGPPHRVRVAVDPKGPKPPWWVAKRPYEPTGRIRVGAPALETPLEVEGGGVEIRVR